MLLDPALLPALVPAVDVLKNYLCAINLLYHVAKISKYIMLLITYQEPFVARNVSVLRSNLERCPYSRGDPDVQPAARQGSSASPGLSTIYGVR